MTQPPNPPQGWWQPPGNAGHNQPQWQGNPGSGQPRQPPPGQGYPPQYRNPQSQPPQQWPGTPSGGQAYPAPQPQAQQQPTGQQGNYGGGFQPSMYGGLGAFGDGEPAKKPRSKKPFLIGGLVLVLLVGGGIAAWLLGAFRGDVLDQSSLQDGVTTVLRDSYGEQDVQNAQCPDDQSATNGTTFECTVDVAGQPKKVAIRVLNEKPEFEVGAPK